MKLSPMIKLVITAILWSTGGVLIKSLPFSPLAIAGARSFVAIIVILLYARPKTIRIEKIELLGAISYALTLICFVTANKFTTASNAIVLQFTAPIWIVLYLKFIKKEHIDAKTYLIILSTMLGMFMCVQGTDLSQHGFGNMIAILSGLSFAAMIITLKAKSSISICLIGNMIVFLVSIPYLGEITFELEHVIYILLLGVVQIAIPYILYIESIPHVSTLQATLTPFLEPLFNPVWVMLLLGEIPNIPTLIGGSIILVSIIYYNLMQRKVRILN